MHISKSLNLYFNFYYYGKFQHTKDRKKSYLIFSLCILKLIKHIKIFCNICLIYILNFNFKLLCVISRYILIRYERNHSFSQWDI